MALRYAYLDASGERDRDRVLTCVAIVAYVEQIADFEREWDTLVTRSELSGGLSMKAAPVSDKPLSPKIPAQSVVDRIEALLPFGLLIRKHLPLTIAVSV